ncbi:MAG TPA: class I SAM-dependent methyltransferase [Chloroflexota bacterium]|nr:class I SAM-dependent methyltransferase [Chloroflexota bacterium]
MNQKTFDSSTVKDVVRRHWAARAAEFDDVPNHGLHSDAQRDAWLTRIQAWAGDQPLDVLDVGCGTGFLALLLAELGHRVTGVDAATEMLDLARAKAISARLQVGLHEADAEHLPFPDGAFDLIVERHVIWTLPDPMKGLAEWSRALRLGGRLVLIEGDWRGAGGNAKSADDYAAIQAALPLYGGRPAAELAELVKATGFADVQIEPLMDEVLWADAPSSERYALRGCRSTA